MDERTTSYIENGRKKTGVTRPSYNANTDYMALMQKAAAAGDLDAAGYYEQQRNDKIAGTGSSYAPTATYADYYNRVDPSRASALEDGYVTAAEQARRGGYLNGALTALKDNYDAQTAAIGAESDAQLQMLEERSRRQKEQQAAKYDNLSRQLYTDMMDERRALPDRLAAMGYTGGPTESSLLRNRLNYEQALRENESERLSGEKDIDLALLQGTLQQKIARNQAERELAGSYATQYANLMGQLQTQQNYEAEQELARKQADLSYALEAAKTKAALGDFSGYAMITDLNGNRLFSDADIDQLAAAYQAQAAAKAGSSGGGGSSRRSYSGKGYETAAEPASPEPKGLTSDQYKGVQAAAKVIPALSRFTGENSAVNALEKLYYTASAKATTDQKKGIDKLFGLTK